MIDNGREGANGLNGANGHNGINGTNGHRTDRHSGSNGYAGGGASGNMDTLIDISVATNPRDLGSVQILLKQLNAGIMNLTASNEINHELRQDLSTKARDIMLALETPRETSMKHIWGEVSSHSTVRGGS